MAEKFFTTEEAAKLLEKSTTAIRQWCEDGKIKGRKQAKKGAHGFLWTVPLSEVQRLIFEVYGVGNFWVDEKYLTLLENEVDLALTAMTENIGHFMPDIYKVLCYVWLRDVFARRFALLSEKYQYSDLWKQLEDKLWGLLDPHNAKNPVVPFATDVLADIVKDKYEWDWFDMTDGYTRLEDGTPNTDLYSGNPEAVRDAEENKDCVQTE